MWIKRVLPWIPAADFLRLMKELGSDNVKIESGARKQVKEGDIKIDLIRATIFVKREALERIDNETRE